MMRAFPEPALVYAIGGWPNLSTVEAYNPATNSWVSKPSMPTGRGYLGSAIVNGVVYAIGGVNSANGTEFGTVEAYTP